MKKSVLFALGLCTLMGLSACHDEDMQISTPEGQVSQKYRYIGFQLNIIGGTDTRSYETGTNKEREVSMVMLAFYDADGNYIETCAVSKEQIQSDYTFVANVSREARPASVLTFVNMPRIREMINGLSLSQVIAKSSEALGNGMDQDGFYMTSSSYLHNDVLTYGTDVSDRELKEYPDDAMQSEPVKLYVERISAKAEVELSKDLVIDIPSANGAKVSFKVDGYAINGTNSTSYLIKNIAQEFNYLGWAEPWNASSLHRSFWAKDPNYNDQGVAQPSNYQYFTYQKIRSDVNTPQYCLENTSADAAEVLHIQNATHVIVVGQYTLDGIPAGTHLYFWNGRLNTAQDYQHTVAFRCPFYQKSGEQYLTLSEKEYKIYRQGVNGKDGAVVALQLKGITDQLYTVSEGLFVPISLDEANKRLLDMGTAIKYGHGKGYYAVPIRHLGSNNQVGYNGVVRNHWYKVTINEIRNMGNGIYDPGDEPGDPKPADPSIEPDDPSADGNSNGEEIIPEPMRPDNNYYLGAQIEVIDWRVVSNDVAL